MTAGDQLASDVLKMEGARTWSELQAVCRDLDARYEIEGVQPDIRRAYEQLRTAHARRVATTVTA